MIRPSRASLLFRISQLSIVTFAVVFVWFAGHRGVFLLDQSIFFDGAWRVFQGQVPYRDFYSAFPPVAFVIQAIFFHLAGVDFSAMVLSAAVINGAATGCVMWLLRRLQPAQPLMVLVGGLVTSLWFAAPLGVLYFEQTAFFFDLLALVLLVKAIGASARVRNGLCVGAGALLALATLSKQNAGAEFVPVALIIAVWPCYPKWREMAAAAVRTVMGFVLLFGCFLLWVWRFSSLSKFWYYYVEMLRHIGEDRIHPLRTVADMLTLSPTRVYVAPVVLALGIGLILRREAPPKTRDNHTLMLCIVLGCLLFQNLFKIHTDNQVEDALPFLGLLYGLAFGFLLETSSRWGLLKEGAARNKARQAVYLVVSLLVIALPVVAGVRYSWGRYGNEFRYATFENFVNVPGMSRVKWGDPTVIEPRDGTRVTRTEFESLNKHLDELNENFFVFVDSTILYGLHKRVSPQPWLYFSGGHSFQRADVDEMDSKVTESLIRNNVRVVVIETKSWLGNEQLLMYLPKLRGWIHQNFQKETSFGIFEVWVDTRLLQERELRPKA